MGADDAALLALDQRAKTHKAWHVDVAQPSTSDEGEFGNPSQLDERDFLRRDSAVRFCRKTARRGLRAVLSCNHCFVGEYE